MQGSIRPAIDTPKKLQVALPWGQLDQQTTQMVWVAGALFIKASQEWLEQFEDVKFEGLQGAGARKTLLVVGIMAAHGLGEGCGVGVSFCGARGWAQVGLIYSVLEKFD